MVPLKSAPAAGCWRCGAAVDADVSAAPGLGLLLQHIADGQDIGVVGPQVRLLDAQRALQQRPPNVVAALQPREGGPGMGT